MSTFLLLFKLSLYVVLLRIDVHYCDELLGEWSDTKLDDPEVKEAAIVAIDKIASKDKTGTSGTLRRKYKLVNVVKANQKVVSGILFTLEFVMSVSECTTADDNSCALKRVQRCSAEVWVQRWMPDPFDVDKDKCEVLGQIRG